MFYKKIKSYAFKLVILSFSHFLLQLPTTLILSNNQIGDQGVQYLANVLRDNKVTYNKTFHSISCSLFRTDDRHTEPSLQSNRITRCPTSCECSSTKQSKPYRNSSLCHSLTISHKPKCNSIFVKWRMMKI